MWAIGAALLDVLRSCFTYTFLLRFEKTLPNGHVPVDVPDLAVILNKYLNNSSWQLWVQTNTEVYILNSST
jgi:hypothetical protein